MSDLDYRLDLVKNIFDLCIKINTQGIYYAFCQLHAHVGAVSAHVTGRPDFHNYIAPYHDAHYECDWLSHEEMKEELAELYNTLNKYLKEE